MLEGQEFGVSPTLKKKKSNPVHGLLKNISKEIRFAKQEAEQQKIQRKVVISQNNKLIGIVGKCALLIYELPEDLSSLNSEVQSLEPIKEFKLASGTYDSILGVHLNEEEVEMSWIVLSSKIMTTVHLLRLDSFSDEEHNEEKDVLGGMLYHSEN